METILVSDILEHGLPNAVWNDISVYSDFITCTVNEERVIIEKDEMVGRDSEGKYHRLLSN